MLATWHEFERQVVKPALKQAKAIVRETERVQVAGGEPPDTRELQGVLERHADAYALFWGVPEPQIRSVIRLPDAELAPKFIATVRSERDKHESAADPDLDPRWIDARARLLASRRPWQRAPLAAAMRAATDAAWVVFAREGRAVGYVERKRISRELANVPKDATWAVALHPVDPDDAWWVCRWKGGRGRLRCRLRALPERVADRKPCVWLHLDAAAAQSMHSECTQPPAPPAEPAPPPPATKQREERETETTMGKAKQNESKQSESKANDAKRQAPDAKLATVADVFGELDRRQLNISGFGTNGRKDALCVLYTRSKPSRKVVQAKGPTLAAAFAACLAKLDATGENTAADASNSDNPNADTF